MVQRQTAVLDAVARAGSVRRLVKLSGLGAESPLDDVVVRWHHEIEQRADALGLAEVVHLRPTMVMQNVLLGLRSGSIDLFYPFGDHPVPEVDAEDVADVAAVMLRADTLPARTVLELTGPRALTYHEIARVLSAGSGVPVRYLDWTPEEFVARVGDDLPPHVVAHSTELAALLRTGFGTRPSGHVELVLGRPARDHRAFARRHAAQLRAAAPGAAPTAAA